MGYYSRLSEEELYSLKDDFIKFLIINGIPGEDWQEIREKSPERASGIIDQFSEVVMESTLRSTLFLIHSSKNCVRTFRFGLNDIEYYGLKYTGVENFSFVQSNDIAQILSEDLDNLEIERSVKDYQKKREHEMYDMICAGCTISKGEVYKTLAMYWAENSLDKN